jgi:uncharacterized protein (TIGR02757 family)
MLDHEACRILNGLYEKYDRRSFVEPDPLQFLYNYPDIRDREIAGLVASSLAYGRVQQIVKSVAKVLERMPRPAEFLGQSTESSLAGEFHGFKHRFATGEDLSRLLWGTKRVMERYGSLGDCFRAGLREDHDTILPAAGFLVEEIHRESDGSIGHLLPLPARGSACKRLFLFLRWMIRRDRVDPGGWDWVSPSKLIVPLDVHMHRLSREMGLTQRNQANLRTALEVTSAFREVSPEDPVKYDFALTRLGIRDDASPEELLQCIDRRKSKREEFR